MKINIYYGGRGLIGDPTLYTVRRMIKVFEELNVRVEKYDLFDPKTNITTLPQSLKEADGIILASTVEWHGYGGYMSCFLDACWLYGDKEKISHLYMAPVIMSTTYGEKEAELDLTSAWQSLGGLACQGLCGYVPEVSELEGNAEYLNLIEKAAENIYRSINQRKTSLPLSVMAVKNIAYKTKNTTLTQQETEQLSEYASDEKYVEKQKEDIRELADLFKGKMQAAEPPDDRIIELFRSSYKAQAKANLKYKITIKGKPKALVIHADGAKLQISYGEMVYPDVEISTEESVLQEISSGRKTFQRAFMEGTLTAKGDFASLRMLDQLFVFSR